MLAKLSNHIDSKHFLIGLGAVATLYVLILVYIFISGDSTIKAIEEKLASKTVLIEQPATAAEQPSKSPALTQADKVDIEQTTPKPEAPTDTKIETEKTALAPAPLPGLFAPSDAGFLPKISGQGLTPFKAYKKPAPGLTKPFIALVIRDYGLSEVASTLALKTLPAEVSLMLSPYAGDPEKWQKEARKNGHELWLEVPFENAEFPDNDFGPRTLLSRGSIQSNQQNLEWALTRTTGYAGIAAHMDDIFVGAKPLLQSLLQLSFGKGLGYLELNPNGPDFIETFAAANTSPYIQSSAMFQLSDTTLESYFQYLERTAQAQGMAIAVLPAYPNILRQTSEWSNSLSAKGISLGPVSAAAIGF